MTVGYEPLIDSGLWYFLFLSQSEWP